MLISRKVLFGNPERAMARLSPDGTRLAYLAPIGGVLNVWVAPVDDLNLAKCVTSERDRGIQLYVWAYDNRHILYLQDKSGDEDFHVYAVNLDSGETADLTPIDKISARIAGLSERLPDQVLVGINDRGERQLHDVYRVDLATGERQLYQENPGVLGFLFDDDFRARLALTYTPEAEQLYLFPAPDGDWVERFRIAAEDAMTTGPQGFDKSGERLYFLDSRGRDKAALELVRLDDGTRELIAESERADLSGALTHPTEKHVQAVTFTHARSEWQVLDAAIEADIRYLEDLESGELQIVSRSLDDRRWIAAYLEDDGPVKYYLYERDPTAERGVGLARFLFSTRSDLDGLPLAKMHDRIIQARDGLELVVYVTLPPSSDSKATGKPDRPLPMVLLVHGGPWARDGWGYDPQHQLWANRGYAVMSVNFRGSTGFGKSFINAGNREWSGKMHDDLIDAVEWAVGQGIARRDKIAIMGGSYGGYAALVGLTFTPEVFACAVDIVGPSNLVTLLQNPPPYWAPFMPVLKYRLFDVSTQAGREELEKRSPLFHIDRICRPLLIAQGQHDPRVKRAESDQIVAAMNAKSIPVTYLLFENEGHGFERPENRFAFYAIAEAFLAEQLGGQCEPFGDALEGASLSVPSGSAHVPGLEHALKQRESVVPS